MKTTGISWTLLIDNPNSLVYDTIMSWTEQYVTVEYAAQEVMVM